MNNEHIFYKAAIGNMLPDREEIRRKALEQAQPSGRKAKRHSWLIPAVACIVAVAVICAAVPPVRAAISQWFERNFSVGSYMAKPAEARPSTPELDAIIEKTRPEKAELPNSIEIVNMVPEWQDWASKLKPKVGDVFFDGKELIVSFDMGGGAKELLLEGTDVKQFPVSISMGNPGYIKLNGVKYAGSVSSGPAESVDSEIHSNVTDDGHLPDEVIKRVNEMKSVIFTAAINFTNTADSGKGFDRLTQKQKDQFMEEVRKVQAYDPEYTPFDFKVMPAGEKLKGVQQVEANIPLVMHDFSKPTKVKDGTVYQGKRIGLIKLRFSFNPEAGNKNMKSYTINRTVEFRGKGKFAWADRDSDPEYVTCTNKTIDMTGVKMTAKRMDVYASGAELYVGFTCPDTWDELDKKCFLGNLTPCTKGDGINLQTSGEKHGLEENGEDLGIRIDLKMLPSELEAIDTFEILPILGYYTGYDDVPYVEGKPTRIKKDEVKGWQEDSKELSDCVLKFSLK